MVTQIVGAAAGAVSLAPCEGSCPMAPWGSCQQKSPRGPSCSRSPKTGKESFRSNEKGPTYEFLALSFLKNVCLAFYLFVEFYTSNHS